MELNIYSKAALYDKRFILTPYILYMCCICRVSARAADGEPGHQQGRPMEIFLLETPWVPVKMARRILLKGDCWMSGWLLVQYTEGSKGLGQTGGVLAMWKQAGDWLAGSGQAGCRLGASRLEAWAVCWEPGTEVQSRLEWQAQVEQDDGRC